MPLSNAVTLEGRALAADREEAGGVIRISGVIRIIGRVVINDVRQPA